MSNKNFRVKQGLDVQGDATVTGALDSGTVTFTTDKVTQGSTNKYYASSLFNTDLATKTTTNLGEGTNLYYTDARVRAVVDNNVDLDVDGSNNVYVKSLRGNTRLLGEMQSTTDPTYVFPVSTLNTQTDNNGYSAASSFPAGTLGYSAGMSYSLYFGDTFGGNTTAPALQFRTANGNSTTGVTVPFTGLTSVAPSATVLGNTLGTVNFNGHTGLAFANDSGTQNQGGGVNATHNAQFQSYAVENFSESTLTLTSTAVTAVASSFRATMAAVTCTGTKGQFSFTATTPSVGNAIRVTGTLSGTATGIAAGTYYIAQTSSTSTMVLSATPGGPPITTTAGTTTGLTFIRCGVTFTMTGQTSVPFGRSALVSVSGVTNVTNGVYPVSGTPTTTSMFLGIPHTVAPTVSGSQSFSCLSAYGEAGLRMRAYPSGAPMNLQNRMEVFNFAPSASTLRTNTVTLNSGAYGTSGVGLTGDKIIYNRVFGQFELTSTTTPVAADTAYVFPLGTATVSNTATVGSTSRLIPGAAGFYNLQFSAQAANSDTVARVAYVWLRKNGANVTSSTGRVTVPAAGDTIISWNYIVDPANTTDYFELAFAVENTAVTFPTFAATAFAPSTASLVTTITPVGA